MTRSPVAAFISYAHADDRLFQRLLQHLSVLVQQGVLAAWHDRRIEPGVEWDTAISTELQRAQLILLLVSPSFMASEYVQGREVKQALDMHDREAARVVPIVLRHVAFERTPIGRLQALPTNAKPVIAWRHPDEAFRDVTRAIRTLLATWPQGDRATIPATDAPPDVAEAYFLNHTSFLRAEKQQEFRQRTGVDIDHYDIRVIVDAINPGLLDQIERVEYVLDPTYPEPIRVRAGRDRREKFLLKELANGESLLKAKVFVKDRRDPIVLYRYLTLWDSGPEVP